MIFVLRQITRRSGAPDIVRTRPLTAAAPVIGRGSDCDIQLNDLAVNLRHAVLQPAAAGRVVVEAAGTEKFEADGRFVTRAELSVAAAPILGFGSHQLTLAPGEEPGDILVTVCARDQAPATVAAGDRKGAFSLRSALFSTRRSAWILSVAILLVCLALPVAQFLLAHDRTIAMGPDRQWSSGPLSPGHHFLEGNCTACHQQAFVSVRDSACLTCHQAGLDRMAAVHLASQMRNAGSAFAPDAAPDHAPHDRLMRAAPPDPDLARRINSWVANTFSHPNNRCASCHTEHVGGGRATAGRAPAPVTPDQITRNDCKDCHTGLAQRLPDTQLADVPDWSHHPQLRPLIVTGFDGAVPRLRRISLDAAPREKSGLIFAHDLHLAADGAVARMAAELDRGHGAPLTCASCHHAESNGGFAPIKMTRDCAACHSLVFARQNAVDQLLPHGDPAEVVAALKAYFTSQPQVPAPAIFLGRAGRPGGAGVMLVDRATQAVRAAFAPGGTCFTCHTIIPPTDTASLDFKVAPVHLAARYLPWGGFDHSLPAHHQDARGAPSCASCHKAQGSAKAQDLLLPGIAQCAACHGNSQAPMAASGDCADCHGFHTPGTPPPGWHRQLARDTLIRAR